MTDTTPTESNLSGLDRKDFQKNINSRKTDLYILKNAQGMEVAVTNYGCAILSIMVPDKNGKFANVILGHDSIEHVITSTAAATSWIWSRRWHTSARATRSPSSTTTTARASRSWPTIPSRSRSAPTWRTSCWVWTSSCSHRPSL